MTAGTYNFTIVQGSTFQRHFEWTDSNGDPWDWTGWGVRAQIRQPLASPAVLLDFNTTNGRIILGAPGIMDWFIGADVTAQLSWLRTADWDMEFYSLSDPTIVERMLAGSASLSPEVTRP